MTAFVSVVGYKEYCIDCYIEDRKSVYMMLLYVMQ
jgi:hypothetical protein